MAKGPKNMFKAISDLRRSCVPNKALRTLGLKIVTFCRFFSSGVPGGCTYFSDRPALQTHHIVSYLGEKSCPTSI